MYPHSTKYIIHTIIINAVVISLLYEFKENDISLINKEHIHENHSFQQPYSTRATAASTISISGDSVRV